MDSSSVGAASQEEGTEITPCAQSNQSNGVPCSKLNNPQLQAIRLQNDEVSSSGDEITAKIRKPYTITKQRERWTEEEHQKFLEALKLHGRAWRRIEEHIGTKTAVQIRSHAQKFFTKLEREASAKGVPVCKTQDINIPPPRPKRKPSHPYPRKAGNIVPNGHCGQTPIEEGNKSTSTVSFPTNGLSVGLNLGSGTQKCAAFTPYNGKAKSPRIAGNDAGDKTMESTSAAISPSSLKLFGQTVVVPRKKTGTDGEGKSAFQEFTASKDESLRATESSDKPHVANTNESNNDPSVDLQIKVGRSGNNSTLRPSNMNPEGLSMVEGSGESNASFLSADDSGQQDSESQMDNNSSFLSRKNMCSVYPRHVLVQHVEGGATDNVPDSVKSGINITSLSNDFAAINMVNSTVSSSNCSAQTPMAFRASALPSMLLPFPGAFNLGMNNPENFTGIPGFLGPPGPNCSIPAWHLNPSSALHHPAFAAAKLAAAAMWPGLVSTMSPLAKGDSQQQPSVSEETSAVAAVTAATVAAASAWWTLHGPIPPPFLHPGVYGPFMAAMAAEAAAAAAAAAAASVSGKASSSCIPGTVNEKRKPEQKNTAEDNNEIPGNKQDVPSTSAKDKAFAKGLEDAKAGSCLNGNYTDFGQQNSPSISEHNTTSCMEESGDAELPADNKNSQEEEEEADDNGLSSTSPDENKPDRKKATERSSSGSNTPESETDPNPNLANATPRNEEAREKELDDGIETGSSENGEDAVQTFYGPEMCKFPEDLAKLGDSEHVRERIDDDDNQGHGHRGQQAHANTTVRRSKPGAHPVSEEGRIAFQALFDRDVLPQNFPPRSKPRTQASGSAAQNRCASSSGHEREKSYAEGAQQQHESAAAVQDQACHEEAKEGYLIMQMDNGFMKEYACAKKQQQQDSEVTLGDCSLEYYAVACGTSSSSLLHNHEAEADHQGKVDGPTSDCKPSRRCTINGRSGSRGFVAYMRCSVEAKKHRLHSRPTQNCQEGSREEKRMCLKQPVEERKCNL